MLIGINELNFETDIVSEIKALEFHLTAPGLALLMLDDRSNHSDGPVEKAPQSMLSHWAVSCHLFRGRASTECRSSNSATSSSSESRIWIFCSTRIMEYNRQIL